MRVSSPKTVMLFPHSTKGRCYSSNLVSSNDQNVIEIRGRKASKFLWFSLVPAPNDSLKNFIPAWLQATGFEAKKES